MWPGLVLPAAVLVRGASRTERSGGTARCGSGAGDAYLLYAPPTSGCFRGADGSGSSLTGPVAGGAALHGTALVLAETTPDAGVLAGLERPLQTLVHHGTAPADGLGFLDLQQRRTGVADGEEELGVFLAANGVVTPVHGCYLS